MNKSKSKSKKYSKYDEFDSLMEGGEEAPAEDAPKEGSEKPKSEKKSEKS
jgi:hypothetical protein